MKGGVCSLNYITMKKNKLIKILLVSLSLSMLLVGCSQKTNKEVDKGEKTEVVVKDDEVKSEEDVEIETEIETKNEPNTKEEAQETLDEEIKGVTEDDIDKIKKEIQDKLKEQGEDVIVDEVYAPKKEFDIDLKQRYSSHPEDSQDDMISSTEDLLGLKAVKFAFKKTDGTVVKLDDFKGKPFIMEIMYTGCGACVKMLPSVIEFENTYPEIPFISISPNESREDLLIAQKSNPDFRNVLSGKNDVAFLQNYPFKYYPTTLFIDEDGYVADVLIGSVSSSQLFETFTRISK